MSRWLRLEKELIVAGRAILQLVLYHDLKELNLCEKDLQELIKIVVIIDSPLKVTIQVTMNRLIDTHLFKQMT